MAKITTPVEGFTGESAGVGFIDSVGSTDDPARIAYFESAGYKVELTKPERVAREAAQLEADIAAGIVEAPDAAAGADPKGDGS